MKIFTNILMLATLLFSGAMSGQDADALLDKMTNKIKGYDSFTVDFEMVLTDDKAGGEVARQSGKASISGEKFKIIMGDYHIYGDGETVWTFEKESNVVYINDFEEMQEEKDISPSEIFTIWEEGFRREHKGTVGGVSKVNLYPTDGDSPFHTIILDINENDMELKKAKIKDREGQVMDYTLRKFIPNSGSEISDFTFDKNNYPGVEEDDQRF